MSKRRDRRHPGERPDRSDRAGRAGRAGGRGGSDRPGRPDREEPRGDREARAGILRDVAILVAAFAIGVGAAELFGAANLGVAFGVGQVVFALTLIVVLTRE
jgi:hypothetical protein